MFCVAFLWLMVRNQNAEMLCNMNVHACFDFILSVTTTDVYEESKLPNSCLDAFFRNRYSQEAKLQHSLPSLSSTPLISYNNRLNRQKIYMCHTAAMPVIVALLKRVACRNW